VSYFVDIISLLAVEKRDVTHTIRIYIDENSLAVTCTTHRLASRAGRTGVQTSQSQTSQTLLPGVCSQRDFFFRHEIDLVPTTGGGVTDP